MYSAGSDSPPHQDKVQVPHPRASTTVKMSSTITIPTSVTCMENVKIASLGQNHFFRSVLNSHLLLQLIYFKLFHFCRI